MLGAHTRNVGEFLRKEEVTEAGNKVQEQLFDKSDFKGKLRLNLDSLSSEKRRGE